ncbi:hypothetical protein [Bradyrhizobium sp. MOS002]|uniref:hypothetical protein n=1 Tax=Bradyrhizobium sp. MOS002 TaxID=2133947 RepID=UPI000D12ACE2|nr:hypothetical protein [Bradyrhizobium sp. MOS002]PSO30527.1 hypothetical protein C7G41_21260 [Bradyrhizobium sp. MOS002]
MRFLTLLIVCTFLAGCQTDSSTPSGRPEVTIRNLKPDQVKSQLINAMINDGGRLKSDSPYLVTFERPWGNAVGAALVGTLISTDASSAVERLSFSIADTGAGTRIVADRYLVKVGSFGREDASPANNGLGLEPLQQVLDRLAAQIKT